MLGWLQHACSRPLFWPAIFTRKVDLADLVFDMQSGFNNRSVRARLQVSVFSSYGVFHPVNIQMHIHTSTHRQHFDRLI